MGVVPVIREGMENRQGMRFKGSEVSEAKYDTFSKACSHLCQIVQLSINDNIPSRWAGCCDPWEKRLIN
jgi:hypothetical protein